MSDEVKEQPKVVISSAIPTNNNQGVSQPVQNIVSNLPKNIFDKPKEEIKQEIARKEDKNSELVESMFDQAIQHKVSTDVTLQDKMLNTASTYVDTKMTIKKTEVDTEHKAAVFDNNKDACECYGFNEKSVPIWATNLMKAGYNVMLVFWWFIGCFTFMPIIFISKKLSVGIKKGWLAVGVGIFIYLLVTFTPIIIAICNANIPTT